MKEVCAAISHMMDESILIYIYIHVFILPYFHQSKILTHLGSLLQCIGQTFCTNFIQIEIFWYNYFIELFFLFFSFFLSHNCFIIVYFNDSFYT